MNQDEFKQRLNPSPEQWTSIYLIIGYAVGISIFWNIPYLKEILWPFKILTVALHEFGHAFAGILTGAKIVSITLDPNEGGLTKMRGGNPYITLPAGYIGSLFWGALMVCTGFSDTGSKVTAVLVGLAMLCTLFWARNWLARIITVLFIGLIALLWWFENSKGLRYFILFLGVMSSLYSLWDIIEDLLVRKVNESDASAYSRLCCGGALGPQFWGFIWFIISVCILSLSIIVALLVFKTDK
ncbi:peptidase M50B-like-domain-containing protein [Globomyces pollinis-pini]|nr:peptidase M50B-like-domain-containing protein [Globomyces pollinis-pini]